jgi:REP-associated tyrosine transposase
MPHTYARNHLHVIFSTKNREKTIPKNLQPELWAYMAGICRRNGMNAIAIGGTDDHLHALFHLPPTMAPSKAVQMLKANASRWMNMKKKGFAWQEGSGIFRVSMSHTATVARYIRNQEAHHRKISYEDEYVRFLKKHGIDFDPRYVFG